MYVGHGLGDTDKIPVVYKKCLKSSNTTLFDIPLKYFTNPLWKHSPVSESILNGPEVVMHELTAPKAICNI